MTSSTLYIHGTIITINKDRHIILDGALHVVGAQLAAVGKTSQLSSSVPAGTTIVDLHYQIVVPGLINTHAHSAQSLLRGLAEDVPLHSWLCDAIWPLEASYEGDDGYVAARLAIAEMLKSGTTCFLESMLTFRAGFDNVARAVGESGIRACLVRQGKLVKVAETNTKLGIVDPRDQDVDSMTIASALAAHTTHHNSFNGRLHVWMAAGTPRGSPASAHLAIGDACRAHDMGVTMHCAEAPADLAIYRTQYGCTPAQFCEAAHLTGPKTVLAHMVNLDDATDLPILAASRTTVAHNPSSNCKLASGIAGVPGMLGAGVNVGLGTDGAPCANTYDMLREMALAALLHKGNSRDAAAVRAEDVLEMATINGARALGLADSVGSLEPGKRADFVVVNAGGLHAAPWDAGQAPLGGLSPVTTLVYSCTGADVRTVVVDGQVLVDEGKLLRMDEDEVKTRARHVVARLRTSAGIKVQRSWPYV